MPSTAASSPFRSNRAHPSPKTKSSRWSDNRSKKNETTSRPVSTAMPSFPCSRLQGKKANRAVNYYKRHGSREDCFLSYYYQGRVYQNVRNNEAALNSFLLAESYISKKTTDSYLSALYNHISAIYQSAFDFPRALTSLQKAEEHARKA